MSGRVESDMELEGIESGVKPYDRITFPSFREIEEAANYGDRDRVRGLLRRLHATARAGLEDRERLDWLDEQKSRHAAAWASPPVDEDGGGGPAYWRDPSVSWTVSREVKCGVYEFPQELADVRVREAIDTKRRSARSGRRDEGGGK
jgi:hypothetical protein